MPVGVHVDLVGGGRFRQAGHRHDVARERHDEARPRRQADLLDVDREALRPPELRRVVREGILRLCHADGQVGLAERLDLPDHLFGRRAVADRRRAVDARCDRFDLLLYRERGVVKRMEIGRVPARLDDGARELHAALAALREHLGDANRQPACLQ